MLALVATSCATYDERLDDNIVLSGKLSLDIVPNFVDLKVDRDNGKIVIVIDHSVADGNLDESMRDRLDIVASGECEKLGYDYVHLREKRVACFKVEGEEKCQRMQHTLIFQCGPFYPERPRSPSFVKGSRQFALIAYPDMRV